MGCMSTPIPMRCIYRVEAALPVGASPLAIDVNDNALRLIERGITTFFASKLAPTEIEYREKEQEEKKPNTRNKKPRSFDQGLCYRFEASADGFLRASRRSVVLEADMAQRTGLEPATPGVTGRYSNRLNYRCVSLWTCVQVTRLIESFGTFNRKPDESDL